MNVNRKTFNEMKYKIERTNARNNILADENDILCDDKEDILEMIEKIYSILDTELSDFGDEHTEQLKKGVEKFCSMWDERAGYVYALKMTMDDQCNNHREDLSLDELHILYRLIK